MNADFATLFLNEILKLRRSLATLMLLLAPLSVVLLTLLLFSTRSGHAARAGFEGVAQSGVSVWAYLVFPLLIALQAAVINGIEHRSDGWKRMFALPIHPARFFLAKLASLIVMMAAACLLLAVGMYLLAAFMHAVSDAWPAVPGDGFLLLLRLLAMCFAGGMFIMVIHHAVSWAMPSFVFPIGLGIVAVMAVFQVGSSKYWIFHPWAWSLMASAASDPSRRDVALVLGVTLALASAPVLAFAARRLRGLG